MGSNLIKDTTREEREQIVRDSLDYNVGCESESTGIDYDLYIEGKKELSELAAEYKANYMRAFPEQRSSEFSCTQDFDE